jgi:chaperonin cofactor prefoldin
MNLASKLSTAAKARTELESLTDDLTSISSRYGNTLFNVDKK